MLLPNLSLENLTLIDNKNEILVQLQHSHIVKQGEIPLLIRWLKEKIDQGELKYTFVIYKDGIKQHIEVTKLMHHIKWQLENLANLKAPFSFKEFLLKVIEYSSQLKLTQFDIDELILIINRYGENTKVII